MGLQSNMGTGIHDDQWRLRMHEKVDIWFRYHNLNDDDRLKVDALRGKFNELAHLVVELTPVSADQTATLRLLREASMTANASIACKGV
jgi:hypothetical protein